MYNYLTIRGAQKTKRADRAYKSARATITF